MPATTEEINIIIQALQANLEVFKKCRDLLDKNEQNEILYPMVVELRNLCETCIPTLKSNGVGD